MKFIRTPASVMSTSRRSLIFGVGVNDSPYTTSNTVNGRLILCPLYSQWKALLQRCYCPKWKERYPTYATCTVVEEWLYYSNFLYWADQHDWEGKHLDKDILISGNKQYGPDTCIWIDPNINRLLLNSVKRKGECPVGVSALSGKYIARISINGHAKTIGLFSSIKEASLAFLQAKAAHVTDIAGKQANPQLKAALLRIACEIKAGTYYS
jgi:hypothetical protein